MALILGLFGSRKLRWNPYLAGLLLGLIKAAIYLAIYRSVLWALIMGGSFAALGLAVVYLFKRLDKVESDEAPDVPVYTTLDSHKLKFRWEYVPLSIIVALLVFGESLL